tara:strand:- start:1886 stop:2350 length:465 start_codon:yes stop_codon:yes gene_type:complete
MNLRQITEKDQIQLKKIYFDSIKSIDESFYNDDQKFAWASQAWKNSKFDEILTRGKGWLIQENTDSIGFATRYPSNKLSLFYVRGNSRRKGLGSILLNQIENDARSEGQYFLKTEASLISYKLLIKKNWKILHKEKVIINDKIFERYKMIKNLI